MDNEKNELVSPSEFARRVGRHPSRITALRSKLQKKNFGKYWMVYLNDYNLSLFKDVKEYKKAIDHDLYDGLSQFGNILKLVDNNDFLEIKITERFSPNISRLKEIYRTVKSFYRLEKMTINRLECKNNLFHIKLSKNGSI